MDNDLQLWNQYKNLWDNMQQANALNYQILGAVIAASVAIFTTGLTRAAESINSSTNVINVFNALIFLAIFAITVPGYKLLQGNRRYIWRVSTYIRVFLEPHFEHLKWEMDVTHQREWAETQLKKGDQSLFSSLASANEWFILFLLNSLATSAATILFWITEQSSSVAQSNPLVGIVGIVITVLVYIYVSISTWHQERNTRRGGKVENDFYTSWVNVKNMTSASNAIDAQSNSK